MVFSKDKQQNCFSALKLGDQGILQASAFLLLQDTLGKPINHDYVCVVIGSLTMQQNTDLAPAVSTSPMIYDQYDFFLTYSPGCINCLQKYHFSYTY